MSITKHDMMAEVKAARTADDAGLTADDDRKVFVSRIPKCIDDAQLSTLLSAGFDDRVEAQVLIDREESVSKGFGFAVFSSASAMRRALAAHDGTFKLRPDGKTLRKAAKLQLRAVERGRDGRGRDSGVCYAWQKGQCRWGAGCKFEHTGEGSTISSSAETPEKDSNRSKKKRLCWAYGKGKCKLGDLCPRLHEGEVKQRKGRNICQLWQKNRTCRFGAGCRFLHDGDSNGDGDKKRKRGAAIEGSVCDKDVPNAAVADPKKARTQQEGVQKTISESTNETECAKKTESMTETKSKKKKRNVKEKKAKKTKKVKKNMKTKTKTSARGTKGDKE